MVAVTDTKKLEAAYKEVWQMSQKILTPSHPALLKVRRIMLCISTNFLKREVAIKQHTVDREMSCQKTFMC